MNATLYEKIGGKEVVKKTSHHLYVNILKDDLLIPFFKDIDVKIQERKMNAFLTYIFGGNSLYTGKTMRRAHQDAVAAGLSDIHFDAMMRCVEQSLHESEVAQDLIDQVMPVIEKHRKDILNR